MIWIIFIVPSILISCGEKQKTISTPASKSVLQVDYSFPTSDKPQSKLWFMDDTWWVLLPRSAGPSLWQRTDDGWKEHEEITALMVNIPGRVDVWAGENEITAVGVSDDSLVVFQLMNSGSNWEFRFLDALYPPDNKASMETATISRDKEGQFWVAADAGDKICIWSSFQADGPWKGPYVLGSGIDDDDICLATTLPEGVGVIWSDQKHETVLIRIHENNQPFERWGDVITIEQGNKTADDHLNAVLTSNGTLWVVTKNSVDEIGQPQFVLRVRNREGLWANYPYCKLDKVKYPSRPVIFAVENNPSLILSGHTIYNHANSYLGEIDFGVIDTLNPDILKQLSSVIIPDTTGWRGQNLINDVTGPKNPFPKEGPWIILASDKEGRVYEADLSVYFE